MKIALFALFVLLSPIVSISQTPNQETENIASFCKIWGFLKYHHIQVASGKIDWDLEFMTRVKKAALLHTKEDRSQFYLDWISSLGPIGKCKKCAVDIPDSLKRNLNNDWMLDATQFTLSLIDTLQLIHKNRNQESNFYVKQNKRVENTNFENEQAYKDSIFPSKEMRLLGLSRYWNIINYFYPYKYAIGTDWNTVLTEMIPKFKDAPDTTAYHLALLELTASINDSHAGFGTPYTVAFFGLKWAPFTFKIIDNKAVVDGFFNDSICIAKDIRLGDAFLTIDGVSIKDIIQKNYKYISGSNEATKYRNFYQAIFNGKTDSIKTTFERDGKTMQKTIYRYLVSEQRLKWPRDPNRDTCKILEGNIGYLNLGLLQPSQTKRYLSMLKQTKGIIIDVRNYPNGTMYELANFLNSTKQPFAKFTIPDLSYPGVFRPTKPYYCGKNNKENYSGKVVLLFNETSQSHAEFTLMALQTAPNVVSVGSQTAGADGNVSQIIFPGNYKTYMTGIGVYYPDGRETQRIGIVPDIEVKPTIEGVRLRKDEVLEKALTILRTK